MCYHSHLELVQHATVKCENLCMPSVVLACCLFDKFMECSLQQYSQQYKNCTTRVHFYVAHFNYKNIHHNTGCPLVMEFWMTLFAGLESHGKQQRSWKSHGKSLLKKSGHPDNTNFLSLMTYPITILKALIFVRC